MEPKLYTVQFNFRGDEDDVGGSYPNFLSFLELLIVNHKIGTTKIKDFQIYQTFTRDELSKMRKRANTP